MLNKFSQHLFFIFDIEDMKETGELGVRSVFEILDILRNDLPVAQTDLSSEEGKEGWDGTY
jgi:hypothetical protein